MAENKEILTPEAFHEILHKDIDKPALDFRRKRRRFRKRYIEVHSKAHRASWARAKISLNAKTIHVRVSLNFKQNNLSDTDYEKLKLVACRGIARYWSRRINVAGNRFMVRVSANHSYAGAIPVDLYVETDENTYARSMNPAMLGIDASFIYNKGYLGDLGKADAEFMLMSAHEFGHSVLMYAGGLPLSWGHKGSTNPLTQSVKPSTPGYPKSGSIDLMKYYNRDKFSADFLTRITNTIAMEVDLKRLIWRAKIRWIR